MVAEYGMGGQASTLGDIYSYGILLLEIFTGKRPTDDEFKGGIGIHQFVAMTLPNRAMEIVDPSLLRSEEEIEEEDEEMYTEERAIRKGKRNEIERNTKRNTMEDCLASLIEIGVTCSQTVPTERLPMTVVVNKLRAIKSLYMGK